jgi:hypothetical protein
MKGCAISQFAPGDAVEFQTTIRTDFSEAGKHTSSTFPERGTVLRLMKSCRQGMAKIRCGSRIVTRRLQLVRKIG